MDWRDQEFIASREHQAGPDIGTASDVAAQAGKVASMAATPPGEPPVDYDVRSVYDARPVNARDFNISGTVLGTVSGSGAIVFPVLNFNTPLGWRFVVTAWEITFAPSLGALGPAGLANTSVSLLQGGGVADPFNLGIIIGPNGTNNEEGIETFMIVEEATQFGIQIVNTDTTLGIGLTSKAIVTIHGNALPVTDVQLPYAIANPVQRGKSGMYAPPMFFAPPSAGGAPMAPPVPGAPPQAPPPLVAMPPPLAHRRGGFAVAPGGYTRPLPRRPPPGVGV
jgi:hypothetical protein